MFSIDLDCKQDAKDLTIAELWEAGSTGIIEVADSETTATLRAFFDDDALADDLLSRFGGTFAPADTRDWVAFAREHLKPMSIGKRLFIIPDWRDDATPEGRIRIVINAGLAFGTGAHETTRMCLEAIERNVRPECVFVDVGTGSGLLAEAAYRLGATTVLACDNDRSAVDVANENFHRAGLPILAIIGSAEDMPSHSADVLAANISPAWVIDLAPQWVRILKRGGTAILSGFELSDVPAVSAALTDAGAINLVRHGENTWCAIEMKTAKAK